MKYLFKYRSKKKKKEREKKWMEKKKGNFSPFIYQVF